MRESSKSQILRRGESKTNQQGIHSKAMLMMMKMMKMRDDGEKKILLYTVIIITLFVSTEVQSLTMGTKLIKVQVKYFLTFFIGAIEAQKHPEINTEQEQ